MLSERLKEHKLFPSESLVTEKKAIALETLHDTAENLVIAMRVACQYAKMDMKEVEDYTVKSIEDAELLWFSEDEEDSEFFIRLLWKELSEED